MTGDTVRTVGLGGVGAIPEAIGVAVPEESVGGSVLPSGVGDCGVGPGTSTGGLAGLEDGSTHAKVGPGVSLVGGASNGTCVGGASEGVGSIQGAGGSDVGTGARGGNRGVGSSSDGRGTCAGPSTHLEGATVGSVRTAGGASMPR